MRTEDEKAHLHLNHHLVDHPMLGFHAQPSNHGGSFPQLRQGRPDTLMTLEGGLPHGSLSHVIHREQSLTRFHGVWPNEDILTQL